MSKHDRLSPKFFDPTVEELGHLRRENSNLKTQVEELTKRLDGSPKEAPITIVTDDRITDAFEAAKLSLDALATVLGEPTYEGLRSQMDGLVARVEALEAEDTRHAADLERELEKAGQRIRELEDEVELKREAEDSLATLRAVLKGAIGA